MTATMNITGITAIMTAIDPMAACPVVCAFGFQPAPVVDTTSPPMP